MTIIDTPAEVHTWKLRMGRVAQTHHVQVPTGFDQDVPTMGEQARTLMHLLASHANGYHGQHVPDDHTLNTPLQTWLAAVDPQPPPAARPLIVDNRPGKAGFPSHGSWEQRAVSQIAYIIGHYTSSAGPTFLDDAHYHTSPAAVATLGAIAPAIAYHIGVDLDGTIRVFNNAADRVWHCGWNSTTIGIVFRGGPEGPNDAQRASLRWLVQHGLREGALGLGWPRLDEAISTHRHVYATACPGEIGEAFYRTLGRFVLHPRPGY